MKAQIDHRHGIADSHAKRVLIVDDSVVARTVISRMVEGINGFRVSATVQNARQALDFLARNRVDMILLDIEMPGTDGLSALPDMLAAGQGARILVVSTMCEDGAATTIHALSLGAADTLEKPSLGMLAGRFATVLEEKLVRLIDSADDERRASSGSGAAGSVAAVRNFDIVAIGASTGGIHALSQLLRELPAEFQLPILITQHLPPSFMSYFAAQIAVLAARPCDVAVDRMRIRPGRIILAPGDAHMEVVRATGCHAIRLTRGRAESGCMPSVDPMFASIAQTYGDRALGIVLSGMGRDGVIGASQLAMAGAGIVAQDQASSVVWGMPGAVVGAGLAKIVLTPAEIGRMIARGRPIP